MATIEDELVCCVCLEMYRDPVILTCSHNLCRECAEGLTVTDSMRHSVSQKILCPHCRQITLSSALCPNRALANIVAALKTEKCKQADQPHEDVLASEQFCTKHGSCEVQYCETCNMEICTTTYSDSHRTHDIVKFEDYKRKEKTKYLRHLDELECLEVKLTSDLEALKSQQKEVESSSNLSLANARTELKQMEQLLRRRWLHLEVEWNKQLGRQLAEYEANIKRVNLMLSKIKNVLSEHKPQASTLPVKKLQALSESITLFLTSSANSVNGLQNICSSTPSSQTVNFEVLADVINNLAWSRECIVTRTSTAGLEDKTLSDTDSLLDCCPNVTVTSSVPSGFSRHVAPTSTSWSSANLSPFLGGSSSSSATTSSNSAAATSSSSLSTTTTRKPYLFSSPYFAPVTEDRWSSVQPIASVSPSTNPFARALKCSRSGRKKPTVCTSENRRMIIQPARLVLSPSSTQPSSVFGSAVCTSALTASSSASETTTPMLFVPPSNQWVPSASSRTSTMWHPLTSTARCPKVSSSSDSVSTVDSSSSSTDVSSGTESSASTVSSTLSATDIDSSVYTVSSAPSASDVQCSVSTAANSASSFGLLSTSKPLYASGWSYSIMGVVSSASTSLASTCGLPSTASLPQSSAAAAGDMSAGFLTSFSALSGARPIFRPILSTGTSLVPATSTCGTVVEQTTANNWFNVAAPVFTLGMSSKTGSLRHLQSWRPHK